MLTIVLWRKLMKWASLIRLQKKCPFIGFYKHFYLNLNPSPLVYFVDVAFIWPMQNAFFFSTTEYIIYLIYFRFHHVKLYYWMSVEFIRCGWMPHHSMTLQQNEFRFLDLCEEKHKKKFQLLKWQSKFCLRVKPYDYLIPFVWFHYLSNLNDWRHWLLLRLLCLFPHLPLAWFICHSFRIVSEFWLQIECQALIGKHN